MSEYATTVLFADLSGSVPLYESIGDAAAKAIVVDLQSALSDSVAQCGGTVHEIIGDEIMCLFEHAEHAILCAAKIHQVAADYCENTDVPSALEMRIGVHSGSAIMEDDRLFGDTINTAARIMSVAQARQTITTEAVLSQLPKELRQTAREFDEITLKGKSTPTVIFDVPWRLQDLTQIQHNDSVSTLSCIELEHAHKTVPVTTAKCPAYLGRALNSIIVVDTDPVSRRHASIQYLRGRFVLSDQSTNGTYVYPDQGETIYLRREQLPLWGTGRISLGTPADEARDHIISYRCG